MKRIKDFILGLFRVYCREFKLILSDKGIMIFLLFLPLGYPIIYSLIYNPELVKEVPFVVVDHDRSTLSRKLVRELDACDEARLLGYAADLPEARRAMDSRQCFAILEIPEGFGRKIGRGETGAGAMYCDMSLLLRYRGFLVAITAVMQNMGAELLEKDINTFVPLAGTIATGNLLPIDSIPMGNIRSGFDSFIMPGVLILILQQCIILALGMAGGARHERASVVGYDPHNNAPSVLATMIGKALTYFTIMGLPAVFMIHYVPLIFTFPMAGNLFEEILFITPMILATIGFAFVFQAFVTERESVFVCWVVTSIIFLLISGLIWPRYDMPPVWKFVSGLCPATWGVEGFVKMNSNGARLWQVSHEYEMLWWLTLGWWVVAYFVQRFIVLPQTLGSRPRRREASRLKAIRES
ncbi:MAG: ABC transporter permease [Muribaculaceae bacterium]|nr:ABC transporter permease [Muribaculaceae bacterium]